MFTSLNVVRIAAVDCDCTRRSATRGAGATSARAARALAREQLVDVDRRRRLLAAACRCRSGLAQEQAAAAGRRQRARARRPWSRGRRGRCPATRAGVDACCRPAILAAAGIATPASSRRLRRRAGAAAAARCGRLRRRGAAPAALPSVSIMRDHLAARRRCAPSPLTIFGQHAGGRRRQLEHDLVGLDVDQVLVALDRLAGLLVPVEQRRLGDRLRQLRDLDFDDALPFSRSVFSPASAELPPGSRKASE